MLDGHAQGADLIYFCIDVEASGPLPPLYNLLSIGATVVRREGDRHVLGETFYGELQPIFPGMDPAALAVCGLDVARLQREGQEPKAAMQQLTAWVVAQNAASRMDPVFVGHNAVFDWAYVQYYYAHFELKNPFGYKAIESKSLAMGRLGIPWDKTSKENLARLLALPPQDPAQTHRADYDAWYQALILQALLDRPAA
jgi:hypothetical protein